jgi:hypothetical protein
MNGLRGYEMHEETMNNEDISSLTGRQRRLKDCTAGSR